LKSNSAKITEIRVIQNQREEEKREESGKRRRVGSD
jgi:hypothetical protein